MSSTGIELRGMVVAFEEDGPTGGHTIWDVERDEEQDWYNLAVLLKPFEGRRVSVRIEVMELLE